MTNLKLTCMMTLEQMFNEESDDDDFFLQVRLIHEYIQYLFTESITYNGNAVSRKYIFKASKSKVFRLPL